MQFGPVPAFQVDSMVRSLQAKSVPFEIVVDEKLKREEVQNTPQNILANTEFRTGIAISQFFFFEVEDVYLSKNPHISPWIHSLITGDDHTQRSETFDELADDGVEENLAISTAKIKAHKRRKAFWAWTVVGFIVLSYFVRRFIHLHMQKWPH